METREVRTLGELGDIAEAVLAARPESGRALTVALSGDLGAGKTAFVKELAKRLGIAEEVTSPTFVIMRSYAAAPGGPFQTLTHIDAYRIESDDEMRILSFEELLRDRDRIVCIEWPEKIENLMPEDAYPVTLIIKEGDIRTVTYGR